jgi:hypothetical protein
MLSEDPSIVTELIDARAVPLLVKLLEKDELPAAQFEAAWALRECKGAFEHV